MVSRQLESTETYVLELKVAEQVLAQVANALAIEFGLIEFAGNDGGLFDGEFQIGTEEQSLAELEKSLGELELELRDQLEVQGSNLAYVLY